MIVVALIPLGGVWYISSYQAREDWRANINHRLIGTAEGVVKTINAWVDMNVRVLRQNAALDDIKSGVAERQDPILKAIGGAYDWTYLVFTTDANGQNIGRNDGNPLQSYADREYFKKVMSGDSFVQQVLVGRTTGKPALILAAPILGGENERLGVIAMAMHLTDVSQQVADVHLGETGFAILVDEQGKAIAHGRPDQLTESLQDLSAHPALMAAASGQEPIVYEQDGKQVVAYTAKTLNGWTLIVQQGYDEAFAPLRLAERNALILLGVSLATVIILALLLAQRLASPIRQLTTTADNLSRGKLDEKVMGTERGDEIGALARAIDRMGVSIRMAFERLQKAS